MLRLLCYYNIFSSIGQTKLILGKDIDHGISLLILSDGNILTGSYGKACQVWSIKNYLCIKTLYRYTGSVHSIDKGYIAVVWREEINILNPLDNFKCIKTIRLMGYNNYRVLIQLLNGNLAFTANCNYNPYIIILDHRTEYSCTKILLDDNISVPSTFSLTKDTFATYGYVYIKIWSTFDYKCFKIIHAHDDWVTSLIFSKGLIISSSSDYTIRVWDVKKEYKCIKIINAHVSNVTCLLLLPGGFFASGSHDRKIKIWDLKTFNCINELVGHKNGICSLALLKDNRIVSTSDGDFIVWNY
jgi:WD40 repeat protein